MTFGITPDASGDRVRLHRMRRDAGAQRRRGTRRVSRAALRREAAARARARVSRRRALRLELGHVRVHGGRDPRRVRAPRARRARRGAPVAQALAARANRAMLEIDAALFAAVPDISIDYAIMEKAAEAGEVAVVRGAFDWSDVGSWQAVAALTDRRRRRQSRPGRARGDRHARHVRARRRTASSPRSASRISSSSTRPTPC